MLTAPKPSIEKAGYLLGTDNRPTEGMRVVQFTPPGSACTTDFSTGMGDITNMQPGSVKGLHLVVDDISTAREALLRQSKEDLELLVGDWRWKFQQHLFFLVHPTQQNEKPVRNTSRRLLATNSPCIIAFLLSVSCVKL
jgi:hypothetical protein